MFTRVSNRQLVLIFLAAVALDLLFVGLGWRWVAAGLTALTVGVPLMYLVGLAREAMESMESYGVGEYEIGPSRPPRLLASPPSGTARPAPSRRRPDMVTPMNRAAMLLLVTTAVMTLRAVVAL